MPLPAKKWRVRAPTAARDRDMLSPKTLATRFTCDIKRYQIKSTLQLQKKR